MSVYFVYRCHYDAPGERHARRFEFDAVVDWVRSIWRTATAPCAPSEKS
jgi:hypothetical protein